MPSLFSLPRELRNRIIDYLIQSRRPIPEYPGLNPPLWPTGRVPFENLDDWPGPTQNHYTQLPVYFESSPTGFEPTCASLLRTCRQLRYETLEQEARHRIPCRLDVFVINGESVWVTWLSMPLHRTPIIDQLEINIRFAGALRSPINASLERAIHPWHMVYLIERLLMRILAQGTRQRPLDHTTDSLAIVGRTITYLRPRHCIRYLDLRIPSEVQRNADEMVVPRGMDMLQLYWQRRRGSLWRIVNPFDYFVALRTALKEELQVPDNRRGLFRGPGAKVFRERIGGFWLGCMGEGVDEPRLGELYRWQAEWSTWDLAGRIWAILAVRQSNGLGF